MKVAREDIKFIHMEKTGGTSVTHALWGQSKGTRGAFEEGHDPNYDGGSTKHLSVTQAQKVLGKVRWGRAFRFTIIRNPWDRMVSKFFWRRQEVLRRAQLDSHALHKLRRKAGFRLLGTALHTLTENGHIPEEWFLAEIAEEKERWGLVASLDEFIFGLNSETPKVNEVLRFENLGQDWEKLVRSQKWSRPTELPHKFKSQRESDYRQYYNIKTQDIVRGWSPKIIRYFGYVF